MKEEVTVLSKTLRPTVKCKKTKEEKITEKTPRGEELVHTIYNKCQERYLIKVKCKGSTSVSNGITEVISKLLKFSLSIL